MRYNNILLKVYYKIFCFLKRMAISIQTNCVLYHVVYSRRYYDCVHHGLQMCTEDSQNMCQFWRATRRELFCSRKMFTCRKLTGVETLLPVSITFQFNENTNTCTVKSEHSDYISHPNTHTHTHTNTHCIYIYIFRNRYCNS